MSCPICDSNKQVEFSVEMMVHPIGLKSLDNPGVLVFQKFSFCLDCGFGGLNIPEAELALLAATTLQSGRRTMQAG
jgi:hypothetical protein